MQADWALKYYSRLNELAVMGRVEKEYCYDCILMPNARSPASPSPGTI